MCQARSSYWEFPTGIPMIAGMDLDPPRALLVRLVDEAGADMAKVSRSLGRNHAYLHQFVKQGTPRVLPEEVREKLGEQFGVSPDEFRPVAARRRVAVANPTDVVELLGELYAVVPVFDARVSAGPGAINEDGAPLHHHLYRMAWLREVTSTPPAELAVVRVEGDSMWETLHNGDHVLMDRRTRRIGRDGIYVLAWAEEDETMVKRAQRDPRNKLITVKSDNPEYQVWPDVPDERLRVFGKVIWLGRNVGG